MRARLLVVTAAAAAGLGAAAVIAVAAAAGWLGSGRTDTVTVAALAQEPLGGDAPIAARPSARPLPGNGFDAARLYRERAAGVVTIYALFDDHDRNGQLSQGSGFVVSDDGYVLTNAHVVTDAGEADADDVEGARRVFVQFSDGERVRARLIGWDAFFDVALLRVNAREHPLAPVPLGDSTEVVVGEPVAAIGSPFGEEGSLAVGVVSAVGRSIESLTSAYSVVDAIQTDAPINRGNSGGPLFDARGRVIGINAQIRSQSGTAEGVGFAIPINAARRSMRQLIATGRAAYAYVGVKTDDMTPRLARRLGYRARRGALIVEVTPGPARRAGLRGATRTIELEGRQVETGGDLIVGVDGRRVRDGEDLVRIVTGRLSPGQLVRFTVERKGRRLDVSVRLAERPAEPTQD